MNFADLKDQFIDQLKNAWGQIQESSLYTQVQEKYEAQTPAGQKAIQAGAGFILMLIIFAVPYTYYDSASEQLDLFEHKKNLIRSLFRMQRATSQLPPLPYALSPQELLAMAKRKIEDARLQPEQIGNMSISSKIIPGVSKAIDQSLVEIQLSKLNLNQVRDLGIELQRIPNVKMTAIKVDADSTTQEHYFNVSYRLANLSIPAPAEEISKPTGGKKK